MMIFRWFYVMNITLLNGKSGVVEVKKFTSKLVEM